MADRRKVVNEKNTNTSLDNTTDDSPHPGKTRVTYFFQWSLKVFIDEF